MKSDISQCNFYSECLELIGNRYSLLYTLSILISIVLSAILLTKLIEDPTTNIIMGLGSLIFAIVPLVFKEKIEKVHGYQELAMDFKNLARDIAQNKTHKNYLEKFKMLTKKLADYPIDRYTKWRVKK